jgi:putative transposase
MVVLELQFILSESETTVSKNTVTRMMKVMDLTARPKKKYVVTTDSDHDFKVPDNLLNREFNVDTLNSVWVSDIQS